jgi:hypothetical protein
VRFPNGNRDGIEIDSRFENTWLWLLRWRMWRTGLRGFVIEKFQPHEAVDRGAAVFVKYAMSSSGFFVAFSMLFRITVSMGAENSGFKAIYGVASSVHRAEGRNALGSYGSYASFLNRQNAAEGMLGRPRSLGKSQSALQC